MTHATASEQAALAYLQTGSGEPWRWTEDGAVLTWTADGGTVVFRDELLPILEWLAPRGLPAFPALAMLLAACRGRTMSLDELIGPAEAVAGRPGSDAAALGTVRRQFRARCTAILDALGGLEGWPRDTLAGTRAKAALAEAVFERTDAWVHSPEQAREIIAGLRDAPLTEAALNRPTGRRLAAVATLQALAGLGSVEPAALTRRLRTGIEEPPLPAPLPPEIARPPAELARRLLDQLGRDPVHAALARAARDLLAALSLPRRLPEPDDAATGGVADVANRGSLDKLLLSELAHDDLTLATRVALSEALYLRNEPPAAAKAVSLALLLDAGVRMWGVPRLFAASAALALGAADARRPGLRAWRADGPAVEPVDLLSAEGFQSALGALSAEADPGAALPAFFAALESRGKPGRTETEAVLLTHRDTLADARFRRALDGQRIPPGVELLVATVDRDGRFELRSYPPGGKPPLCAVTIHLDEIQRDPGKPAAETGRSLPPAPLLDGSAPGDLPVILSLPKLPFLLPVRGEISTSHAAPGGRTFAVDRSRRLLAWKEARHGVTTLAAGLPPGRTLLLQTEADTGRVHLLKDQRREGCLTLATYDPASGEVRTVRLAVPKTPPLAAQVDGGVVLLFYPTRADVFRLSDGEEWASIEAPERACWKNGRYYRLYRGGERWCYVSWDGMAAAFHPIRDVGEAQAVFDRTGRPGPWMLTGQGEVCHVESRGSIFALGRPVTDHQWVCVSRDGHHLYLASKQAGEMECIDLKRGRAFKMAFEPRLTTGFVGEPFLTPPQCPVMHHFSAVCVLPSGNLALRSRGQWWWEFRADGEERIRLCQLPVRGDASLESRARPFAPVKLPRKTDYRLKVARWPAGGRAFLDNRGLLHLKFPGSSTEFSLVLSDAPAALWASDGRMSGAGFFLGPDQPRSEPGDLLATLRDLCTRLR
ncbi:MAG: hypothetical protein INR65_14155 [Gluconacetobacter diazotrophicus]|nr:hypothetical protein [Gluconacetobacter diazotrophicus]